jgi:hypothetical protein
MQEVVTKTRPMLKRMGGNDFASEEGERKRKRG